MGEAAAAILPEHVMQAFHASGQPRRLSLAWDYGWRVGAVAFSRAVSTNRAAWSARIREKLQVDGVRVVRPVRSADSRFINAGWRASSFVPGELELRPDETLAAALRLDEALREVEIPEYLRLKDQGTPASDPFRLADAIAWAESPADVLHEAVQAHQLLNSTYQRTPGNVSEANPVSPNNPGPSGSADADAPQADGAEAAGEALDGDALPPGSAAGVVEKGGAAVSAQAPNPALNATREGCVEAIEKLSKRLRTLDLPVQVTHADMLATTIYASEQPPVVTDLVGAVHPFGTSAALVAADSIALGATTADIVQRFRHVPEFAQLVGRSAVYRLAVHVVHPQANPGACSNLERLAKAAVSVVSATI